MFGPWVMLTVRVLAAIMNTDPDNICTCQEEMFKSHYKFNCEYLDVYVMVSENNFVNDSRFEYISYCTRDYSNTSCSGNAIYDDSTSTVHLDAAFNYTDHTWKRLLRLRTTCNNDTGETLEEFQLKTCQCTHLNNSVALDRGVCHGETLMLEFIVCPFFFSTNIAPVSYKTPSSKDNYLLQCGRSVHGKIQCIESEGRYNESTNMLSFNFTFNRTVHAGKFLRIKTNSRCASEDVTFYPLRQRIPRFHGLATTNKTHVSIRCEDGTCNVSTAEIHIAGRNATCNNFTRLPGGLTCVMEYLYNSNETISCLLDGVTYNLTNITYVNGTMSGKGTSGQGRCNLDNQQLILMALFFPIAILLKVHKL